MLSIAELRACGLTDNAVATRVRRGWLHRTHPGVYAVGHAGLTLRGRFLAAVKACGGGAALSYFAAAALWELVPWDDSRLPDVTIPGTSLRRIRGINVHRTRLPVSPIRFDGIPVTSPARTLIDLSSVLPFKSLRRAVREAQARKRVHLHELAHARSAALKRILATGVTPTRSELEDAVLDLILRGGLTKPQINVTLHLDGIPTTPDFRWPDQHLVIEADGRAWHDHRLAREDDAERQARLEAHGERVVRVTWRQAIAQPAQTLARIKAAGAPALP